MTTATSLLLVARVEGTEQDSETVRWLRTDIPKTDIPTQAIPKMTIRRIDARIQADQCDSLNEIRSYHEAYETQVCRCSLRMRLIHDNRVMQTK